MSFPWHVQATPQNLPGFGGAILNVDSESGNGLWSKIFTQKNLKSNPLPFFGGKNFFVSKFNFNGTAAIRIKIY